MPGWAGAPLRVLLVTLLFTALCFALSLFLGIAGLLLWAAVSGRHPNMAAAYRQIAVPTALAAGAVTLIAMIAVEIRRYRRARVLAGIERVS
ncbi:MAG TPA: hypothetical protein VGF06_00825 [Terriglobales bacterium]|jgi:uncharacterized membrane protein